MTEAQALSSHSLDAPRGGWRILSSGFTWSACAQASAFELPPEKKAAKKMIEANLKWVQNSAGMLAPVHVENIKIVTTEGGHTTMGLRAVEAGCSSPTEDISQNGRLSKALIIPYL